MLRFIPTASYAVGKVPFTGILLTGMSLPRSRMISAVNSLQEGRASDGHRGALRSKALVTSPGYRHLVQVLQRMSTAAQFFCTTDSPRLP
jgi:hypothetical protein